MRTPYRSFCCSPPYFFPLFVARRKLVPPLSPTRSTYVRCNLFLIFHNALYRCALLTNRWTIRRGKMLYNNRQIESCSVQFPHNVTFFLLHSNFASQLSSHELVTSTRERSTSTTRVRQSSTVVSAASNDKQQDSDCCCFCSRNGQPTSEP